MKPQSWAFLLIWAGILLGTLVLMSRWQLVDYDPNGMLLDKEHSTGLAKKLAKLSDNNRSTAIHITDSDCFCNLISQSHRQQVSQLLKDYGYSNKSINLSDFDELRQWITAVPSIILFDADSNLTFIGPYSTGLRCSAGKGLIESWLTSSIDTQGLGPTVISEAKGCYCPA
ncbi:DUF6436 domain-containing protein [Lacimicrobium alkaliphilum]|uniref:DUF6436 domain-containing protein n=1 Tax=Lacimicrobium alkaliphilum TaxID=1526571 RepID=A0A0U3B5C1_9ALTE|nr:DUF6436 domain-containing protein [Lacimicrobium alkaliphilum]ALS98777.1 hypothetical protein AT746_11175 [Lacimicrobium alkaliphilum]